MLHGPSAVKLSGCRVLYPPRLQIGIRKGVIWAMDTKISEVDVVQEKRPP